MYVYFCLRCLKLVKRTHQTEPYPCQDCRRRGDELGVMRLMVQAHPQPGAIPHGLVRIDAKLR